MPISPATGAAPASSYLPIDTKKVDEEPADASVSNDNGQANALLITNGEACVDNNPAKIVENDKNETRAKSNGLDTLVLPSPNPENSSCNDNHGNSFRFAQRFKQVRYGHKHKDKHKETVAPEAENEVVDTKKLVDSENIDPNMEPVAVPISNINPHSGEDAQLPTALNTQVNGDSALNPCEEPAPKTPSHEKGKGKRQFFNSSIFRTTGRRNSYDANTSHTNTDKTTNAESTDDPLLIPSTDPDGDGTSPLEPSLTDPANAATYHSTGKNTLHKIRSKSDVGIYGPIDLRGTFFGKLGKHGHNNSQTGLLSSKQIPEDPAALISGDGQNPDSVPNDLVGDGEHPDDPNAPIRRHTLFSMDYNPVNTSLAIKNAFKRFKKKRHEKPEEENPEEHSELIAELSAGIPAAMIVPMSFLKDERNIKRIPVLMQHLKAYFTDITRNLNEKNRKYQIDLRYGSGSASLEWSIVRDYKDLMTMHSRLKVLAFQNISTGPKLQLPKFPSRHHIAAKLVKAQALNDENNGEQITQPESRRHSRAGSILTSLQSASNLSISNSVHGQSGPSSANSESRHNQAPLSQPRPQLSTIMDETNELQPFRSGGSASTMSISSEGSLRSIPFFRRIRPFPSNDNRGPSNIFSSNQIHVADAEKEKFCEALRQALEKYMLDLFNAMRFRPEANRIFQFLELSNMSMRLAPENSYHGKEGYLILRSSAPSMGWRVSHWKPNELSLMIDRHTSRWYLVRESYIVCVNDISSVNVTEVFMVDPYFKVTHGLITGGGAGTFSSQLNEVGPVRSNTNVNTSGVADISQIDAHQGFTFEVANGERKMKLVTTSQRQLGLWIESINHMTEHTVWSKPHRFQSFAPVRQNVQARWFVDAVSIFDFIFLFFIMRR